MQNWKRWLRSLVFLCLIVGIVYVLIFYYAFVFAKNVEGRIVGVKRENQYEESYVVAIRTQTGETFTSHSKDAQWALVQVGQCARAKFFPHPPWDLEKSGGYFGAKILHLRDCTESDGTWDPSQYCGNTMSNGGNQPSANPSLTNPGVEENPYSVPERKEREPELGPEPTEINNSRVGGVDGKNVVVPESASGATPETDESVDPSAPSSESEADDSNFQKIRAKYLKGAADT